MFTLSHFHPMLVHFPIALIMVGFLAELGSLYFRKEACLSFAGFWLLILGTLAALAAYLTGEFFTGEMTGTAGGIKSTHELFANITLWTMLINAVFRIYLKLKDKETTNLKWLAFAIYAVSAISVTITGFYGGTLVFNYMMPL
jgi:uncharacterized membrane protein